MRAIKILPLFVFLLLFIFTTPAQAGLLNVSDIGDALVYQASPTKNYGTTTQITVQGTTSFTDRAFLLFNITDIPASSTISAATLKLYAFKTNLITNPKYYLVYNTSVLNASGGGPWYEGSLNGVVAAGAGISLARNITWQTQPAVDTLQDNKSVNSTEGIWYSWDVTGAVQGAYASGNNISLLIKENTENNASGRYIQFYSKEFGSNGPILEITYAPNASDCSLSCGDCDCNSTQCFYPSIVGSYCDPDQLALLGYADRILTKFANCTGDTSYECPTGSICGQITPQVNITSPLVENFVDCSVCWYAKVFNIASGWHTLWTNCPLNPECDNCNGIYCQGNAFVTNLTSTPASASGYSAGCFNPDLQLIPIVIQPNGTPTSDRH